MKLLSEKHCAQTKKNLLMLGVYLLAVDFFFLFRYVFVITRTLNNMGGCELVYIFVCLPIEAKSLKLEHKICKNSLVHVFL